MNNERVSMVLPCYNHAEFVVGAIQSIIDQDYADIELIIIDDGSSDESVAKINTMVQACEDRFVRFEFRVQPNKGLIPTINDAIEWMQGRYYSGLASDDQIYPSKTSTLVAYLRDATNVAAVFGGYDEIDNHGVVKLTRCPPMQRCDFKAVATKKCRIYAPSQLLRLDVIHEVGGFDESLPFEDWPMWLNMTHAGYELLTVPEILSKYRRHGENTSNGPSLFDARLAALARFDETPMLRLAKSRVIAGEANQIARRDKTAAQRLLRAAFKKDWHSIAVANFWKAFAKSYLSRRS